MAKPSPITPPVRPQPILEPSRIYTPDLLHPLVRSAVAEILDQLKLEHIPFELFESYRTPTRQSWLFEQGRTRPGAIVTHAKAWESYHNYGLAADLVLKLDTGWSWDASGQYAHYWDRMHTLAENLGLEVLKFERPHVQMFGMRLSDLQARKFPGGGDDIWWSNLQLHLPAIPVPTPPDIPSPSPSSITA